MEVRQVNKHWFINSTHCLHVLHVHAELKLRCEKKTIRKSLSFSLVKKNHLYTTELKVSIACWRHSRHVVNFVFASTQYIQNFQHDIVAILILPSPLKQNMFLKKRKTLVGLGQWRFWIIGKISFPTRTKLASPFNVLASHDLGINVFYSIFQFHFIMNQGNFKPDQIFIMLINSEATH